MTYYIYRQSSGRPIPPQYAKLTDWLAAIGCGVAYAILLWLFAGSPRW